MKVIHYEQMEAAPVDAEGAVGCRMCCLIGPNDAAPSFSMRRFEVAPGGHTPKHSHAHEHEVFVLEGNGVVLEGEREHAVATRRRGFCAPERVAPVSQHGPGHAEVLVSDSASAAWRARDLRGRVRMRRVKIVRDQGPVRD